MTPQGQQLDLEGMLEIAADEPVGPPAGVTAPPPPSGPPQIDLQGMLTIAAEAPPADPFVTRAVTAVREAVTRPAVGPSARGGAEVEPPVLPAPTAQPAPTLDDNLRTAVAFENQRLAPLLKQRRSIEAEHQQLLRDSVAIRTMREQLDAADTGGLAAEQRALDALRATIEAARPQNTVEKAEHQARVAEYNRRVDAFHTNVRAFNAGQGGVVDEFHRRTAAHAPRVAAFNQALDAHNQAWQEAVMRIPPALAPFIGAAPAALPAVEPPAMPAVPIQGIEAVMAPDGPAKAAFSPAAAEAAHAAAHPTTAAPIRTGGVVESAELAKRPLLEKAGDLVEAAKRNLIGGAAEVAASLGTGIKASALTPDAARAGVTAIGQHQRFDIPGLVRTPQAPAVPTADVIRPTAPSGLPDHLREIGTIVESYWTDVAKQYPSSYEGRHVADEPSLLVDPQYLVEGVARMVPSFAAALVPAGGAARYIQIAGQRFALTPQLITRLARIGAAVTGGAVGGGLEGMGIHQEVERRGGSPDEAARSATVMALAVSGLNALSFGQIFKAGRPGVAGKLKDFLTAAGTEAVTEGLEEPAGAAILGDDVLQAMREGGIDVMAPAFLTGGLAKVALGGKTPKAPRARTEGTGGPVIDDEMGARLLAIHDMLTATEAHLDAMEPAARQALFDVAGEADRLNQRLPEIEEAEGREGLAREKAEAKKALKEAPPIVKLDEAALAAGIRDEMERLMTEELQRPGSEARADLEGALRPPEVGRGASGGVAPAEELREQPTPAADVTFPTVPDRMQGRPPEPVEDPDELARARQAEQQRALEAGEADPESRYGGDVAEDLMGGAEEEMRGLWGAIVGMRQRLADHLKAEKAKAAGKPHETADLLSERKVKTLREGIASERSVYEGMLSELRDAVGSERADQVKTRVEGKGDVEGKVAVPAPKAVDASARGIETVPAPALEEPKATKPAARTDYKVGDRVIGPQGRGDVVEIRDGGEGTALRGVSVEYDEGHTMFVAFDHLRPETAEERRPTSGWKKGDRVVTSRGVVDFHGAAGEGRVTVRHPKAGLIELPLADVERPLATMNLEDLRIAPVGTRIATARGEVFVKRPSEESRPGHPDREPLWERVEEKADSPVRSAREASDLWQMETRSGRRAVAEHRRQMSEDAQRRAAEEKAAQPPPPLPRVKTEEEKQNARLVQQGKDLQEAERLVKRYTKELRKLVRDKVSKGRISRAQKTLESWTERRDKLKKAHDAALRESIRGKAPEPAAPPASPRTEPTPAGEQVLVPGTPTRTQPPGRSRPTGTQADETGPLFERPGPEQTEIGTATAPSDLSADEQRALRSFAAAIRREAEPGRYRDPKYREGESTIVGQVHDAFAPGWNPQAKGDAFRRQNEERNRALTHGRQVFDGLIEKGYIASRPNPETADNPIILLTAKGRAAAREPESPAPAPAPAPAAAPRGFTRTGTVDYRELPKGPEWERQVYTTGGDGGRVVGEDADNLYVSHLAGSMARVAKYPKAFIDANQAYWAVGSRIDTNQGPAEIVQSPRLDDRGFRTLRVKLADGTEKMIAAREPFVKGMPMPAQFTGQAAPAPADAPPARPVEPVLDLNTATEGTRVSTLFTLPRDLDAATPRYGYGARNYELAFESALDKALYIAAQPTPSARDADYVSAVRKHYGVAEAAVRAWGRTLRDTVIKPLAKNEMDRPADRLWIPAWAQHQPAFQQRPTAPAGTPILGTPRPEPSSTPVPAEEPSFTPKDPAALERFVRSHGGVAPSPTGDLKGEYAAVPLRFKNRKGLTADRMAQAIAEAWGQPYSDADLLRDLGRIGRAKAETTARRRAEEDEPADLDLEPAPADFTLEDLAHGMAFPAGTPERTQADAVVQFFDDLIEDAGGVAEAKAMVKRLGAADTLGGLRLTEAFQRDFLERLAPDITPSDAAPPPAGRIFDEDKAAEALERLKAKFQGPAPEGGDVSRMATDFSIIPDLVAYGGMLYEGGLRDFDTWSARMVDAVGPRVRPYLRPAFDLVETHYREATGAVPVVDPDHVPAEVLTGQQSAPPPPAAGEEHGYSSTQIDLPEALATDIREWARGYLSRAQLAGDGFEDRPHVTIKYGLHAAKPATVEALLEGEGPFPITLGRMAVFTQDDQDVLHIAVKSPRLHALNKKISDAVRVTDTYPTYTPHVTVAYVKKGQAAHLVGDRTFEGRVVQVDHVSFMPKDGSTPKRIALAPPAPARTPASPGAAYEHAKRLGDLVRTFRERLEAKQDLPKDPRALRKLAGEVIGLHPHEIAGNAAALDDIYDAVETAVNQVYRARRQAGDELLAQIERARKTEEWLGSRTRTIELGKRQQFSTPLPIAEVAAYAADLRPGDVVLEPTAGTGNLLAPLPPDLAVRAVELDPRRAETLRLQGYPVTAKDYLRTPPGERPWRDAASVVIMNPPWGKHSKQKYGAPIPMPYGQPVDVAERFVVAALRDVADGTRLVAVMPTTVLEARPFLDWLEREHTLRAVITNPPGSYDTRSTTVNSVILVLDKGRVADAPAPIRGAVAEWGELAGLVEPLARGGTHARALVRAEPRPARGAPGPGPVGEHPGRTPSGAAPAGRPGAGPAPADAAGGGDRRGPEAGVPGVRGPAGAGAGDARPGVVAPPGGRGRPDGGGAPRGLRDEPGRDVPAPQEVSAELPAATGERYSAADPRELEAASRSPLFAPAPLRSAPGRQPHPRLIVVTRSLAGAQRPSLTYTPRGRVIGQAYNRGAISDQQLDYGVIPALQANAQGKGYLAAADVGVGKTRVAALVIGEWLETGDASKLLYVTATEVNVQDVIKEFDVAVGGAFPFDIVQVKTFKESKERPGSDTVAPLPPLRDGKGVYLIDRYNLVAYWKALQMVGLDGIIGDEAHLYKNIEDAKVGKAWLDLEQGVLGRRGKFLYLTATPAVDFDDLEQFIGLREWTAGAGFQDYKARVTGTAPEATGDPRELRPEFDRLLGLWTGATNVPADVRERVRASLPDVEARGLSRERQSQLLNDGINTLRQALLDHGQNAEPMGGDSDAAGVTKKAGRKAFMGGRDVFGARITPAEQEQIMRELAMKGLYDSVDLWRAGVEFNIVTEPLTAEQLEEYRRLSEFYVKLQRAFDQFGPLNELKKFYTIRHFLQQEAKRRMFDFRLPSALAEAEDALARGEQVVFSTISVRETNEETGPIPAAINSINARQIEVDDAGNIAVDEEVPEALAARAALLDEWKEFRQLKSPVQMIVQAFGGKNVAVIIGDTPPKMREKMIAEFQNGTRQVALISDAGKTGISLHHVMDTGAGARGRRRLIVMDYDWSATTFKQLLGRVDRSGQISAPAISARSTGAAAERKFLATIANRMRNLGALSKGSAESASNEQLVEFEIGGPLDTQAMRLAYQGLPREIQEAFLAKPWREYIRDPGTGGQTWENTRGYPQQASLKDFLLDLQFMPIQDSDRAFDAFWKERERLIALQQAENPDADLAGRTRSNRGRLLRTTALTKDLSLHEVQDEGGHRFAVLQGLITPNMALITRFLPVSNATAAPIRHYLTFSADTQQFAGLEIRPSSIEPLKRAFGHLGKPLETPEDVLEALQSGDTVPLEGVGLYTLKRRPSDGLIQIQGARMADQAELLRHGAKYRPTGNLWVVPEEAMAQFLARFPVKRRSFAPTEQPSIEELGEDEDGPTGVAEPRRRRYARRRDATEQTERLADQALADLDAAASRPVSSDAGALAGGEPPAAPAARTLAHAFRTDLIETGKVSLRGSVVRTPQDLAVLAQVYRDPRFETFRIVYVRANKVVAHEGLTARMPSAAPAFLTDDPAAEFAAMRRKMRELRATGYYMLHNHPSGDPTPSADDRRLTEAFKQNVAGFKAHVVIDSEQFAVVTGERTADVFDLPDAARRPEVLTPSIPHRLLGREIGGPADMVAVGQAIKSPTGYVTLVYRSGTTGAVRGIQEVPQSDFVDTARMKPWLEEQRRVFGSPDVLAYLASDPDGPTLTAARALRASDRLFDLVWATGGSLVEREPQQLRVAETLTPMRVEERRAGYEEEGAVSRSATEPSPPPFRAGDEVTWPDRRGRDVSGIVEEVGASGLVYVRTPRGTSIVSPEDIFRVNGRDLYEGDVAQMATPPAPTFYSALRQAIVDRMPESALPQQVGSIARGPGVKAEEVKWTGLDDWLAQQAGKVSKADVLAFLDANQIRVVDDVRAEPEADLPRHREFITGWDAPEIVEDENSSDPETRDLVVRHYTDRWQITGSRDAGFTLWRRPTETAPWEEVGGARRFNHVDDAQEYAWEQASAAQAQGVTQYEQYTLPGGQNYRELLLVWPVDQNKAAEIRSQRIKEAIAARDALRARRAAGVAPQEQDDLERQIRNAETLIDLLMNSTAELNAYPSPHFHDAKNVLAHVRFNERTDDQDRRVLFLEEVQSDWHEEGRRKGYRGEGQRPTNWRAQPDTRGGFPAWSVYDETGYPQGTVLRHEPGRPEIEPEDAVTMVWQQRDTRRVPPAPFAKTWHELALRRMIRWAAEHDFDVLAWTPGDVQADRYDLSKHVDRVSYNHRTGQLMAWKKGTYRYEGALPAIVHTIPIEQAVDYIGKDAAAKLMAAPPENGLQTVAGLDLKIGGEGMRGFYDRMLPQYLERYAKKWGAAVTPTTIKADNAPESVVDDVAAREPDHPFVKKNRMMVSALPITPAMKASVVQEGQPLFAADKDVLDRAQTVIEERMRFRRALRLGRSIPGTPQQVADTTEKFSRAVVVDLAERAPHVASVTRELATLFDELQQTLREQDGAYADAYLYGVAVDPEYYAVNVSGPRSAVLMNPWAAVEHARVMARAAGPRYDPAAVAARVMARSMVHEFTHQLVRDHSETFESLYQQNLDRARVVWEPAAARIAALLGGANGFDAFVRDLDRLVADPSGAGRRYRPAPGPAARTGPEGPPSWGSVGTGISRAARPEPPDDLRRGQPDAAPGVPADAGLGRGEAGLALQRLGIRTFLSPEEAEALAAELRAAGRTAEIKPLGARIHTVWASPEAPPAAPAPPPAPPVTPEATAPTTAPTVAQDAPPVATPTPQRPAPATQASAPVETLRPRPQSDQPTLPGYRRPVTGAERQEVEDKRRLVLHLEHVFDLPIRVGRFTQRGAQGIFKVKPEVIRVRRASMLGVAAHEIGHFLRKRQLLDTQGYEDAMGRLAEGLRGDPLEEGPAQFVRHYVENPDLLIGHGLQGLVARFETTMQREWPDGLAALLDVRGKYVLWRNQPVAARFASIIDRSPKAMGWERLKHASFDQWWGRFRTIMFDDLHPIRLLEKAAARGETLPTDKSAYIAARLTRGEGGRAEAFVNSHPIDFRTLGLRRDIPGLKAILGKARDISPDLLAAPVWESRTEFEAYLIMRRTQELAGSDNPRLQAAGETMLGQVEASPRSVDEAIRAMERDHPEFAEAADELQKWNDALLDYMTDSGRYDRATIATIKRLHRNYVPFYRVFEEWPDDVSVPGGGNRFADLPSPVKTLRGSERRVVSPLESLLKNAYAMIAVADRNEVGNLMVDLIERTEGHGKLMEHVPPKMQATRFMLTELKELEEALGEAGILDPEGQLGLDLERLATVFRPVWGRERDVILLYRNGAPQKWQVDPWLYRAMMNLDRFEMPFLTRIFEVPARFFRAGVVLNPIFQIRNYLRDQVTVGIQSRGIPFYGYTKALVDKLTDGQLEAEWKAAGGAIFSNLAIDRPQLERTLQQLMEGKGERLVGMIDPRHPVEAGRAWMRMLSDLTELSESPTRHGVFQRELANPRPEDLASTRPERAVRMRAAYESREASVDFRRGGAIRAYTRLVAFLGPTLQGMEKFVRVHYNHPFKMALVAALMILGEYLLHEWNKTQEGYDSIPSWQRDLFFVVALPGDGVGGIKWLRLPGPFEYKLVYSAIPRRIFEWLDGTEPEDGWPDLAENLWDTVSRSGFNPIPTAALPIVENFGNWTFFTERPIEPRGLEDVTPGERFTPRTTQVAKRIGALLDYSPAKIDHLIGGYGGTLARELTRALDGLMRDSAYGDPPTSPVADWPLIRGFVIRDPNLGSDHVERFYQYRERAIEARRTLDKLKREQRPTDEWERAHVWELALYRSFEAEARRFSQIRKGMIGTERDPVLTGDQKRAALDQAARDLIERAKAKVDGAIELRRQLEKWGR